MAWRLRLAAVAALVLFSLPAFAQFNGGVTQSGAQVTPGHVPSFTWNGIIGDSGGATGTISGSGVQPITDLGITAPGMPMCVNDNYVNAVGGYHQLCLGSNATINGISGAFLSLNSYGGATPNSLNCYINGSLVGGCFGQVTGFPEVNTNTALQALTPNQYPTVVRTGFNTNGDVPPLTYIWQSACGGTVDNGAYVAPSSGGSGCWAAQFGGPYNVEQWGAKNGGVADASAAFNAAAAAVSAAGGGTIEVPTGAWLLNSNVSSTPTVQWWLDPGVTFSGSGTIPPRFLSLNSTQAAFFSGNSDAFASRVTLPSGSTSVNNDAIAAYIVDNMPSVNAGQAGNATMLYANGVANVSGAYLWGLNPGLSDKAGITGAHLQNEFDFNISNAGTVVNGLLLTGQSTAQPTQAPAISIAPLDFFDATPHIHWTYALITQPAATSGGILLGPVCATGGSSCQSQGLSLGFADSGGNEQFVNMAVANYVFDLTTQSLPGASNGIGIYNNFSTNSGTATSYYATTASGQGQIAEQELGGGSAQLTLLNTGSGGINISPGSGGLKIGNQAGFTHNVVISACTLVFTEGLLTSTSGC